MSNIPEHFLCPITYSIMTDPVIADDGYTYERSSIMSWLSQKNVSPMTRQTMSLNSLKPNRLIKDLIDEFLNPALANTGNQVASATGVADAIIFNTNIKYIRSNFDNEVYCYSLISPESSITDKRIPTSFICIIDVSGSMGSVCSNKTGNESDGFSRLDLTKHSLNTTTEMLNEFDELVIIKFSTTAECVFQGKMNPSGKAHAKEVISNLKPENSTNIWASLQLAYNRAKHTSNPNVKMLLLTDGESNIDPPMGILPTLEKFLKADTNADIRKIPITTFGFSCDIDSKLLFDIAELTNGGFNFIPDASMVGTTFINFLANYLATENIYHNITIADNIPSDTQVFDIAEINPNELYEMIRFHTYQTLKLMCFTAKDKVLNSNVKTLFNKLKDYIERTIKQFKDNEINPVYYKMIVELYKDFKSDDENEEQIYKAISSQQWFKKWGYHYLLSLGRAHNIRKCHNFRDKGVQLYGGTEFEHLRDLTNDVFCQIPAPTPSVVSHNYGYYGSGNNSVSTIRSASISMSNYVDSCGPCFAPFCKIKLADESVKELQELDGSELLFLDGSNVSKIKYITKTRVLAPNSITDMCTIKDLVITPWHPIYDNTQAKWVFPSELIKPVSMHIEYFYNIVLEDGYYVWINNIMCVSMGHSVSVFDEHNKILEHPYYGTKKVIEDLESFRVGSEKVITINNYKLKRDSNNLICAITEC